MLATLPSCILPPTILYSGHQRCQILLRICHKNTYGNRPGQLRISPNIYMNPIQPLILSKTVLVYICLIPCLHAYSSFSLFVVFFVFCFCGVNIRDYFSKKKKKKKKKVIVVCQYSSVSVCLFVCGFRICSRSAHLAAKALRL